MGLVMAFFFLPPVEGANEIAAQELRPLASAGSTTRDAEGSNGSRRPRMWGRRHELTREARRFAAADVGRAVSLSRRSGAFPDANKSAFRRRSGPCRRALVSRAAFR